jgi:hypothetical protein
MTKLRMRWARHVAHIEEIRNVHKILDGKPGGKTTLRIPSHRWEDNIKMDHREIGWDLAQGRDQWQALVNIVMKLQVP